MVVNDRLIAASSACSTTSSETTAPSVSNVTSTVVTGMPRRTMVSAGSKCFVSCTTRSSWRARRQRAHVISTSSREPPGSPHSSGRRPMRRAAPRPARPARREQACFPDDRSPCEPVHAWVRLLPAPTSETPRALVAAHARSRRLLEREEAVLTSCHCRDRRIRVSTHALE